MAIATVVTRGFGNGTYTGTIGLVVTHGFLASVVPPVSYGEPPIAWTMRSRLPEWSMVERLPEWTMPTRLPEWTMPARNEE